MDINDLNNYLGHAASEATEDQKEEMLAAAEVIDRVYPDRDGDDNADAFSAAVQVILGDSTTETLVDEWKTAMANVATANTLMRGALAVEVSRASELAVAEKFGLNRGTVRKAVGK